MSLPFDTRVPFVELLGFSLHQFEAGQCELRYAPKPEHLNNFGVTHGGALMSLLDVVMAMAARSATTGMAVVTIEMKTSFMRPAQVTPGQTLVAQGAVQHRTHSMAFTEGRICGPDGQLCAMATATFKYMPRPPALPAAAQ